MLPRLLEMCSAGVLRSEELEEYSVSEKGTVKSLLISDRQPLHVAKAEALVSCKPTGKPLSSPCAMAKHDRCLNGRKCGCRCHL